MQMHPAPGDASSMGDPHTLLSSVYAAFGQPRQESQTQVPLTQLEPSQSAASTRREKKRLLSSAEGSQPKKTRQGVSFGKASGGMLDCVILLLWRHLIRTVAYREHRGPAGPQRDGVLLPCQPRRRPGCGDVS